jgi:hypothetical protein
MAGKYGIVETRELILFFKTLILRSVRETRVDGFQPEDLKRILNDPQLLKDFFLAVGGAETASKELHEIDFMDGLELGKFLYACVVEIVSELKV